MLSVSQFLFFFIVFISLCACKDTTKAHLTANKVALVDVHKTDDGTNFLFRGDVPINQKGNFAAAQLEKFLREKAKKAGYKLPKTFYLIDYSLINPTRNDVEYTLWNTEKEYFQANADKGEFNPNLIQGTKVSPDSFKAVDRNLLASNLSSWLQDDLNAKTNDLKDLLKINRKDKKSVVVYVHCLHGVDRTGEVIGAYAMKFLDSTLAQAYKNNSDVGNRDMEPENGLPLYWYCTYLQQNHGRDLSCQIDWLDSGVGQKFEKKNPQVNTGFTSFWSIDIHTNSFILGNVVAAILMLIVAFILSAFACVVSKIKKSRKQSPNNFDVEYEYSYVPANDVLIQ